MGPDQACLLQRRLHDFWGEVGWYWLCELRQVTPRPLNCSSLVQRVNANILGGEGSRKPGFRATPWVWVIFVELSILTHKLGLMILAYKGKVWVISPHNRQDLLLRSQYTPELS